MSTLEDAIFTRTSTFAGLVALQDDRVYPNDFPADVEYPATRYFRVDDPSVGVTHDGGPSSLGFPRYQFDIYTPTPEEAHLVREQLRICWEGYRGTVSGVNIQGVFKVGGLGAYEKDVNLHRETLDFVFHCQMATA